MSKVTLFYATKKDILPVLMCFESNQNVKYVFMGGYSTPDYANILTGSDIPDLGTATSPSAGGCDSYLVFHRDSPVNMRQVGKDSKSRGFILDQMVNPDTIEFTPAGVWNDEIILHGRIATASDSKDSLDLLKSLRSALKQHFVRVKACYVGPYALELLKQGKRLTLSTQTPRDYDLKI